MLKLDVMEYRDKYLKEVETHLIARKDQIPHFTTENLHEAVMTELNRADEDTWEIEVPDDHNQAVHEAEERITDYIKEHVELGIGRSY